METLSAFIDIVLHLDQHLSAFFAAHGALTYGVIALVLFCETGLVVTPFLPGDSLLFAIGALSATSGLQLEVAIPVFALAAIAGDNTNHWIGRWIGPKAFRNETGRFLNKRNLQRAQDFYAKHGPKAITLCRFMPFFRTFVPFISGIARMPYATFLRYSVLGGVAWVSICCVAGYFFGNIPAVKKNFELVVIGIILVSALPAVSEFLKARREKKAEMNAAQKASADQAAK